MTFNDLIKNDESNKNIGYSNFEVCAWKSKPENRTLYCSNKILIFIL